MREIAGRNAPKNLTYFERFLRFGLAFGVKGAGGVASIFRNTSSIRFSAWASGLGGLFMGGCHG